MGDLRQMRGGGGPDLAAGRIAADQMGEGRLDRGVAADQRVIVGVRNLGRVVGMIKPVVMRDLAGERLQIGGGFEIGLREWGRGCHGSVLVQPRSGDQGLPIPLSPIPLRIGGSRSRRARVGRDVVGECRVVMAMFDQPGPRLLQMDGDHGQGQTVGPRQTRAHGHDQFAHIVCTVKDGRGGGKGGHATRPKEGVRTNTASDIV